MPAKSQPRCVKNRWGQGTTYDSEPKTSVSNEMEAKLAAMKAERDKQDLQMIAPPVTVTVSTQQTK